MIYEIHTEDYTLFWRTLCSIKQESDNPLMNFKDEKYPGGPPDQHLEKKSLYSMYRPVCINFGGGGGGLMEGISVCDW